MGGGSTEADDLWSADLAATPAHALSALLERLRARLQHRERELAAMKVGRF